MKKNIFYIIFTILIMSSIFYCSLKYVYSKESVLNDNYIAIFKGENNSTYVYTRPVKKKGKTIDVVFKYVNTVTTYGYDKSYSKEEVLKKNKVKNIDELFDVAKNNNSYNYVYIVSDNNIVSVDEYYNYLKSKKVDTYE